MRLVHLGGIGKNRARAACTLILTKPSQTEDDARICVVPNGTLMTPVTLDRMVQLFSEADRIIVY